MREEREMRERGTLRKENKESGDIVREDRDSRERDIEKRK